MSDRGNQEAHQRAFHTCGWISLLAGVCAAAHAQVPPLPALMAQPVRVELFLPPARTHVIGDQTPLRWSFQNTSTQMLAFMWEGCCLNNGKVEIIRLGAPPAPPNVPLSHTGIGPGIYNPKCTHCRVTRAHTLQTVESLPPGTSLAHQFARAVRLAPGATQEFTTTLGDWVKLEHSGDYRVRGQYLGVHPKQRPQMPRGVALWNGRASTPEFEVSLLSVADYLAERPAREQVRLLALSLTGPAALVPFQPFAGQIRITNSSREKLSLDWPADADLWIIAGDDRRVVAGAALKDLPPTRVDLEPGSARSLALPLPHDLLAGEALGDYRLFVELRETAASIRVPSNPVPVRWQLDTATVSRLVAEAGDQPLTGARNAPLRLLRTYLADLGGPLRELELPPLSLAAQRLATDLRLAASLKSFAPRPGPVDLDLSITAGGEARLTDGVVVAQFGAGTMSMPEQLRRVLAVRHHLGWDVGLALKPEPATRLAQVARALDAVVPFRAELAAAPGARVFNDASTAFSTIGFLPHPVPANLILRVAKPSGSVEVSGARRLPDPQRPGLTMQFSAEEIARLKLEGLRAGELGGWLGDGRLDSPRPLILASPGLTWQELVAAIGPLVNRGLPLDVVIQ